MSDVRAWKLLLRKKEGKKVGSRLVIRTLKRAQINTSCQDLMRLSTKAIHAKLRLSYKAYRDYKKHASSLRKKWLHELAKARATAEGYPNTNTKHDKQDNNEHDKATSKHIRMLIQIESTRLMYRRIHQAVGKGRMQGVSMVIAPDEDGNWNECHKPDEIFRALIKEYKSIIRRRIPPQ